MAGFNSNDVLNEMSRVFTGSPSISKNAGVTDNSHSYSQLTDLLSTSLLFNPDGCFHLSKKTANLLSAVVTKEISFIDDMLTALSYIGNTKKALADASDLHNASNALLALESSKSLKGRPELKTFDKYLTRFATKMRDGLVDSSGSLTFTGEESRYVLRSDLDSLKEIHDTTLTLSNNLSNFQTSYESVDIPSKVSKSSIRNIRVDLQEMTRVIEDGEDVEKERKQKLHLLRSLTQKSAVGTLASAPELSELKYRGPSNAYPSKAYWGRVAGDGTPASITTFDGPWSHPLSDLTLVIDSGSPQTIPLSDMMSGVLLVSRNSEPFVVGSSNELYITTDPEVHLLTASLTQVAYAQSQADRISLHSSSSFKFSFKHLGATIFFTDFYDDTLPSEEDRILNDNPSAIIDLDILGTFTPVTVTPSVDGHTAVLEVTGFVDEKPAHNPTAFTTRDVGRYVKDSIGHRFEVLEYVSATEVLIETRGITYSFGASSLWGMDGSSADSDNRTQWGTDGKYLNITFAPPLTTGVEDHTPTSGNYVWTGHVVNVGPAVKRAVVTAGSQSASAISTQLNSTPVSSLAPGTTLGWHFYAKPDIADPTKVVISARSRLDPYMSVSALFLSIDTSASPREPGTYQHLSVHEAFGLYYNDSKTDNVLTPDELLALASGILQNVDVELDGDALKVSSQSLSGSSIEVTEAPSSFGLSLGSVYGATPSFEAVDSDGALLQFKGVVAGDTLEIGSETYTITGNNGQSLEVNPGLPSTLEESQFEIKGFAYGNYTDLKTQIDDLLTSKEYLGKYKFNESLEQLDAALSPILASGSGLASSGVKARSMLNDLRESLSQLLSSLDLYEAPTIESVDVAVDGLSLNGYDRSVDLLLSGDFVGFYNATVETATYDGMVLSSTKAVAKDLPDGLADPLSVSARANTPIFEVQNNQEEVLETENAPPNDRFFNGEE